MAIQMLIPACTAKMVEKPPSMMNSPWARLITRIMPKITASPTLTSARLPTVPAIWSNMTKK
jgi:hypothetical protein